MKGHFATGEKMLISNQNNLCTSGGPCVGQRGLIAHDQNEFFPAI